MKEPSWSVLFMGLLGALGGLACFVGCGAGMVIILARIPALANTKLVEVLSDVLLEVSAYCLFAITVVLINHLRLARRSGLPQVLPSGSGQSQR